MAASRNITSTSEYVSFIQARPPRKREYVLYRGQRENMALLPRIARLRLQRSIPETERRMLQHLKRQALPHLGLLPDTDWDWLALAQQFGMATRLLDWTQNPLAALWFAVEKPPAREGTQQKEGVVWVFRAKESDLASTSEEDPFSGQLTKVFQPDHITPRLAAQSGWFTVHKYVSSKKRFVRFEQHTRYKKQLAKLTVPGPCFADLREQLDRLGVNAAALFPDVAGLCAHLSWLYSYLEDESAKKPSPKYVSRIPSLFGIGPPLSGLRFIPKGTTS